MRRTALGLFCAIVIASVTSVYAETLNITLVDYCPYQCLPEKEQGRLGYMADVVQKIFEKNGVQVTFHAVPFARAIKGTENGMYDATLSINKEHSSSLLLSCERIGILNLAFYVKQDNSWRYAGVESLENVVVGNVVGYNYSASCPYYQLYLQRNQNSRKVQCTSGHDAVKSNLQKIIKGRITTFNEDALRMMYLATQEGVAGEIVEAGMLGKLELHMGFSPDNPDSCKYMRMFDQGIRDLRRSGCLARILARYGMQDWEKQERMTLAKTGQDCDAVKRHACKIVR